MKLPKILYVKIEHGQGEDWLNADAVRDALVEDDPTMIATYKLMTKETWQKQAKLVKKH